MRVKILFHSETGMLPKDYRQVMLSFFKRALTEYRGGEYFEKYFGHVEQKPFSFALLLPNAKFVGDTVQFARNDNNGNSQFEMILSCGSAETFLNLVNAFVNQQGVEFITSKGVIKLMEIHMLPDYVCGQKERFKLLSPLCIREHDSETNRDRFYSAMHDDWHRVLKTLLHYQYFDEFGMAVEDLKITLINPRKTVVKMKGIMIEATLGSVQLEGNKELIQKLYDNGIGSKTTTFGLLG